MAVYRRTYTAYTGALTPKWSRFLVFFRYSRRSLFRSKFQTGLFVACFFFPTVCLLSIYLAHNLSFLEKLGAASQLVAIDNKFFFYFMNVQGVLAFLVTAFAGPDFAGPRQRCTPAVLLPPVFTRGVCAGKILGAGDPAFANHVDAGTRAVRSAGKSGGRRLDLESLVDCG